MTTDSNDAQDTTCYRVYLLRLWRDRSGPWHAVLQAADAAAPHRFADLEALIAFLRDLVRPAAAPDEQAAAPGEPDTGGA